MPRLQGEAGDFTFDQLPIRTTRNYCKLIKELENRFGVIETARTYRIQFSRRRQLNGETPEKFAAELKCLYDKAYKGRDSVTRQENLLQRFLLGLQDFKARVHLELNKDPKTIEEAVQEVITYTETMKNPNNEDGHKRSIRQVNDDIETKTGKHIRQITPQKERKLNNTGKLNGKRQNQGNFYKCKDERTSGTRNA